MNDTGYKDNNPWHSWINLVFGLMCDHCHCETKIDWSQVYDSDNDDFLRQCVAVAERAQKEGWQHLGGTRFVCPSCVAVRSAAGTRKRNVTTS